MNYFTIFQLKSDWSGKLHGGGLNDVPNVGGLINEAARAVNNRVDLFETKKRTLLDSPYYSGDYRYNLPEDVKNEAIINVKSTTPDFKEYVRFSSPTDDTKRRPYFYVDYENHRKYLVINDQTNKTHTDIELFEEGNPWTADASVSNFQVEYFNYVRGESAQRFDKSSGGSSTTVLSANYSKNFDLASFQNKSSFFLWLYLPTPENLSEVELRFGTDSSNVYKKLVTRPHDADEFYVGWNLIRFDWNHPDMDGSPTTDVPYFELRFSLTAQTENILVDSLFLAQPRPVEITYYSHTFFTDENNDSISETTQDTDRIYLSETGYNMFLYHLVYLTVQALQGSDGAFDEEYWRNEKNRVEKEYRQRHPSEIKQAVQSYYEPPDTWLNKRYR